MPLVEVEEVVLQEGRVAAVLAVEVMGQEGQEGMMKITS